MAYVRGDQAAALREFEPLAKEGVLGAINGVKFLIDDGYAGAWYIHGYLLETGKYGNTDVEQAYNWYRKAADNGDARAQFLIGQSLEKQDVEEAYRWYSKSANQGNVEATSAQTRLAPVVAAIEKKRAGEYAAAERKRVADESAARQREQSRLAKWRKTLQIGDDTHCGPIIEVRRPMFKVALIAQIQGFGNESWLKEQELFTPEYGCRNVNGRLSTQ